MILSLESLGHQFNDTSPWLFRNLNETVRQGDRVALTGPSGSGKSTLLSIVAGWVPAAEGKVVKQGISRIQWVFQNPHGVAKRSAIDHVALPLLAQGLPRGVAEIEALHLCAVFGLQHLVDQRPFAMLSGGEAQRLMLARAVAAKPDLLLVDEPTAQLDRQTAVTVNDAISELSVSGGIVLIATHDETTAAACSRVVDLSEAQPWTLPG